MWCLSMELACCLVCLLQQLVASISRYGAALSDHPLFPWLTLTWAITGSSQHTCLLREMDTLAWLYCCVKVMLFIKQVLLFFSRPPWFYPCPDPVDQTSCQLKDSLFNHDSHYWLKVKAANDIDILESEIHEIHSYYSGREL